MNAVRSILVATDFGPASERALEAATELAQRFDAKLSILHVLEPWPPAYGLGAPVPPLPIEALNVQRAGARKALDATVARARATWHDVQGIFRDGKPWRTITAVAQDLHADLVVVGSHGRRVLPHRLLGGVAERVVRLSPIPVLTVHGFWFEDRVDAGRELAAALEPMSERAPAIIAISRGGMVVGAEIARRLHASLEVLLTERLEWHGVTLGAICEGGMTHFSRGAVQDAMTPEQRESFLSKERAELDEEATRIRGYSWLGELWRRTVILVSDGFTDPWTPLAAGDAIEKMAPETIVLAAPVASHEVLATLKTRFPQIIVLHALHAHVETSAAYRNFDIPPVHALARLLHENIMALSA